MQTWDPAQYSHHASFVPQLGAGVLELLAPQRGERILDLGCGDGVLTEQLAALGVEVVGVDASPQLVAAAQARGLNVQVVDGQQLAFSAEFDAVFSNAALHWMKRDPDAVIRGVWQALRPGGRFVAEMGGAGCVGAIREALGTVLARRGLDADAHEPWYFPGPDEYSARLRAAGFEVRSIELFPRPTPLTTDIDGWLATFAQNFLEAVPADERAALLAEVRTLLAPRLKDASGRWIADYTRLRFHVHKH